MTNRIQRSLSHILLIAKDTDGQPKPHFAKLVFSQLKNHLSSKAGSLTAKALSNYSLPVKSGTLLHVAKGVEECKYVQQL